MKYNSDDLTRETPCRKFSSNDFYHDNDSLSGDIIDALQPRKKRIRKRTFIPRLVRTDVRRHVAFMLANVFNASDRGLLRHFLSRYATADLKMAKSCIIRENLRPVIQLSGVSNVSDYWAIMIDLDPDRAVSVDNVQVRTFMHTKKSQVQCRFTVKVSKLYDITPSTIAKMVEKRNAQQSLITETAFENETDPAQQTFRDFCDSMPVKRIHGWSPTNQVHLPYAASVGPLPSVEYNGILLKLHPRPIHIELTGTMTLGMNEERLMETLDMSTQLVMRIEGPEHRHLPEQQPITV